MRLLAFATWVLCGASALAAPRLGVLKSADLDGFLAELQREPLSFTERIARVSERFLGTRYVRDPLGEGPNARIDRDPIIDLTRVDCLTFVEQVFALAQRSDLKSATELLQRYRYAGGKIRYASRRHFMELQWLPGLEGEGLLRDVTAEVAGEATRTFEREVNEASYGGPFRRFRRKLGEAAPVGKIRIPYVTAGDLARVVEKIPSGVLLSLMRRTPETHPTTITHVGLVVRSEAGLVFRHAIHIAGRVVDVPIRKYLAQHAADAGTLGFHLALPLPAH